MTDVESPTDGARATAAALAGPGCRATPLVMPAIVPRVLPAPPAPDNEWPVLVAARREAEEIWADFLEGDASVYDIMRARRQLELLLRRRRDLVLRGPCVR